MSLLKAESPDSRLWLAGCFAIVLIKLWLLSPQEIVARTAPHDDTLFVGLALNILQGEWLGAYNQFTLMKGSGYPLFIAFSNIIGIPLILSQELLYLGACFAFTWGLRLLGSSTWFLWVAFGTLAFNPFTYNFFPNVYPFRFGIYPAVSLMIFAVAQIILIQAARKKRHWALLLVFGLLLGWFWNIRGEAIWIAPSLAVFLLAYWYFRFRTTQPAKPIRSLIPVLTMMLWVYAGFFAVGTSIALTNYQMYGVYTTNEMTSPAFKSAYGALLRIRTNRWERFIPVNREAREIAYPISPSFKRLEQYFEYGRGTKSWMVGMSDYPAAYFPWAFRDALYSIGFFREAPATHSFLRAIGSEIDQACDSDIIECRPRYTNLAPAWHSEWNGLAARILVGTVARMVKFSGFVENGPRGWSLDDDKLVTNYRYVTNSPIRPQSHELLAMTPPFHKKRLEQKRQVLLQFAWLYRRVPQVLFVLAVAGLGYRLFRVCRGAKLTVLDFLCVALLGGLCSYAAILTILQVTSYSQIGRQLNTTYPLVLAFLLSSAASLTASFRSRKNAD